MSYTICGYFIGESCVTLCRKCISKETTQVELDYLTGYRSQWEIKYWPVREKDGTTKISPRGAVVMRDASTLKSLKPRTFDGHEITAFSEDSYGGNEGESVECEGCNATIIEAYGCKCRECDGKMYGGLALKLDNMGRYTYCEECIEKLMQIKKIPARVEDIYKKLIPVVTKKQPKINLGPGACYVDAYHCIKDAMEALKNSDSPAEFKEYVDTELEKFEYLAHKHRGPAVTVFRLLEKIDEITYLIDGISENLSWDEMDDIEKMSKEVEHYHNYGY